MRMQWTASVEVVLLCIQYGKAIVSMRFLDPNIMSAHIHVSSRISGMWGRIWLSLVFWWMASNLDNSTNLLRWALSIMASIRIWAPQLCNKGNIIHTNNQALCHVINNSTSKNSDVMALVRTLVITLMQFNVLNMYQWNRTFCLDSRLPKFRERSSWSDHQPTSIPEHILPSN